jgi:cyclophilin family peptidyl-prolyl cis-trans isomerase
MFRLPLHFILCLGLTSSAYSAKVLPVLLNPLDDLLSDMNDSSDFISLNTVFATKTIDNQVVRFTSQSSNGHLTLDFALFADATPVTRTNFLKYVSDGDYVNSIIHRSVPGFVIQGGGYYTEATSSYLVDPVPTDAPIVNEFEISNTYGTISMAKQGGASDSATSQWFVSIGENTDNLDNQNGGFTVFGRVTNSTLPNAAAFGNPTDFPVWNAGGALSALPLSASFDNSRPLAVTDLIRFTSVTLEPIGANDAGESTSLSFSIIRNTNPSVATATITTDSEIQISYIANASGNTTITVRATDSVGNTVDDTFNVSVQSRYSIWRASQFSGDDLVNHTISGPSANHPNGLTNLERYVYNLKDSSMTRNPVEFSETEINAAQYPTLSFSIRSNLSDISTQLQHSTDLGQLDPWETATHVELARQSNGTSDAVTIRSSNPNSGPTHFYRLQFELNE